MPSNQPGNEHDRLFQGFVELSKKTGGFAYSICQAQFYISNIKKLLGSRNVSKSEVIMSEVSKSEVIISERSDEELKDWMCKNFLNKKEDRKWGLFRCLSRNDSNPWQKKAFKDMIKHRFEFLKNDLRELLQVEAKRNEHWAFDILEKLINACRTSLDPKMQELFSAVFLQPANQNSLLLATIIILKEKELNIKNFYKSKLLEKLNANVAQQTTAKGKLDEILKFVHHFNVFPPKERIELFNQIEILEILNDENLTDSMHTYYITSLLSSEDPQDNTLVDYLNSRRKTKS